MITIVTTEIGKRAFWPRTRPMRVDVRPDVTEVAFKWALNDAMRPSRRVLLLTHKGLTQDTSRHQQITLDVDAGNWPRTMKKVADYCGANPGSTVVINDIHVFVKPGQGAFWGEVCKQTIERIESLCNTMHEAQGDLTLFACIQNPNNNWKKITAERKWRWREFSGALAELMFDSYLPTCSTPCVDCQDCWYHSRHAKRPPMFKFGPLTGTQQELAAALFSDGKPDRRRLKGKVERGVIWVRRINRTKYEAWSRAKIS